MRKIIDFSTKSVFGLLIPLFNDINTNSALRKLDSDRYVKHYRDIDHLNTNGAIIVTQTIIQNLK
jgi:hypothetical protein